ncbi:hypothetical protein E2562_039386 [Oryza meyeriana var. granulata]|uniref:Uncharacterized protein n=1 Tax=Oryza meyeriana var. granulata TaxID=110450 RepID=A0A6G1CD71_9ORYZ|nr:hypothetical protein E2562_039386 [Oryza meyeriana var. granulata]
MHPTLPAHAWSRTDPCCPVATAKPVITTPFPGPAYPVASTSPPLARLIPSPRHPAFELAASWIDPGPPLLPRNAGKVATPSPPPPIKPAPRAPFSPHLSIPAAPLLTPPSSIAPPTFLLTLPCSPLCSAEPR